MPCMLHPGPRDFFRDRERTLRPAIYRAADAGSQRVLDAIARECA
ncbi:hypothetical protein AB0L65_54215 [Nonomuraea sp. NPDC052116]